MPGESVFVPPGPKESKEKSPGGNNVAGTAKKHLPGCRRVASKAGDLETTEHHAGRRAAEDREQRKILQIDDGEGYAVYCGAELAESELPAQRSEQREEATISEEKARCVNRGRETSFFERSHWVEAVSFGAVVLARRG